MPRRLTPVMLLVLAALACNLVSPPAPGAVETSVAATLTALAPDASPTTAAATPAATATSPAAATNTAVPPTAAASEAPTSAPTSAAPGCTIAYAQAATLYCLPAGGGEPVVIATGSGLYNPRISSDGQRLAYQVVVSEGVNQLWVAFADPAAGPPQMLVSNAQVPNADPTSTNSPNNYQWLAGTHTIVFDTRFIPGGGPFGPGEYINADLWTVDADTGAVFPVLPAGSAGFFAASPDGHTIAVSRGTGLDLVNADGTNYRKDVITFPTIITYSEYTYKPRPQWSSDGTFFTVAIPSADPLAADSTIAFHKIGADGAVQILGPVSGNAVFGGAIAPQLAPDGTRAVFSVGQPDGSGDVLNMVVFNGDGSTGTNSFDTQTGPRGLGWAPDSQHYAYAVVPPGGSAAFVLGLTDPSAQVLTGNLTALNDFRWLDASTFLFIGQLSGGDRALYRQTIGGEPELLAGALAEGAALAAQP